MKASLDLRIGQSLTMTPQLQQSLRLLQMSSLELQQEIRDVLERNPLLEQAEGESSAEPQATTPEQGTDRKETREDEAWTNNIQDRLVTDSSWEDYYPTSSHLPEADDTLIQDRSPQQETLIEHLLWQLNLTHLSENDRLIAETIVNSLDENGFLVDTLDDLVAVCPDDTTPEDIEPVLRLIQRLDPPGVACRDLKECLGVQLDMLDDCPANTRALARRILARHLKALGTDSMVQLSRRLRAPEEDTRAAVSLIRCLNPCPADQWIVADERSFIPDVIVRRAGHAWLVELNPEITPRLSINDTYTGLFKRGDTSRDSQFIKGCLEEARWLIKSVHSRNDTLLRVARKIVEMQAGFLEHGDEGMRPMVLSDIAQSIGMHDSTISRAVNGKLMMTPQGMVEMKRFFSSGLQTRDGGHCSSTAVRAVIRKLIDAESPAKPMSDSLIASVLKEQGVDVARRTVAKYRESMGIPSSSDRKRLA
jgi:RNA polymerase sigma-54 factor